MSFGRTTSSFLYVQEGSQRQECFVTKGKVIYSIVVRGGKKRASKMKDRGVSALHDRGVGTAGFR